MDDCDDVGIEPFGSLCTIILADGRSQPVRLNFMNVLCWKLSMNVGSPTAVFQFLSRSSW